MPFHPFSKTKHASNLTKSSFTESVYRHGFAENNNKLRRFSVKISECGQF